MRKKGFTLIELIVVIAIIGVLAALLVPAMLGYVKKAKIQAANTAASEIARAMNAVLSEENGDDTFTSMSDGVYGFNSGGVGTALDTVTDDQNKSLADYVNTFSDEISGQDYVVYIKGGVVVAVATKNGKYFGTHPAVLTNKNYEQLLPNPDFDEALNLVLPDDSNDG